MNSDHSREIIEAAPSLPSFSVSEKLALYGSAGLSGMELLVLLVGKKSIATALVRHFGSLKALSHASFRELRQFLPRRQAEAVMAALSVANVAEAEHALSARLNNPEAIYTRFLFCLPCNYLFERTLNRIQISRKWLQAHFEIVEDRLLVRFGRGDFLELHGAHHDLFAADRRQSLDHVAHCPLSIFVGAVGGE